MKKLTQRTSAFAKASTSAKAMVDKLADKQPLSIARALGSGLSNWFVIEVMRASLRRLLQVKGAGAGGLVSSRYPSEVHNYEIRLISMKFDDIQ